jgi:hypothetical protein
MRNSTAAYDYGKVTGRSYLSMSLSLLIVIVLVLSGNAQSTPQVRKRVLGIGFASPEPGTSISNDDIDVPTSGTSDDIDAPIISDGMVIDEGTITPTVTEKAGKYIKATKSPGAKKSRATITLKLTKGPSKIDGGKRKLGIDFVSQEPGYSITNDSEHVPITSGGMVQDGSSTEPTTTSKAMKSVKAKTPKFPTSKNTKDPTEFKASKSSKKKAAKASTEVDNEGKLADGVIEFGSTSEPTSSSSLGSSSTSSTSSSSLTSAFYPTFLPTVSPTQSPTQSPTGVPIGAHVPKPTLMVLKSSKKTKAPTLADFVGAQNPVVPKPEAIKKSKTEETKKSKATKAPAVI